MWLLKLLAIFLQISLLLAQIIGHEKCGRPKEKRGQSGGTGHSTGEEAYTVDHAWALAIVIPCKSAAPILECDEYGYTDDGYLCDGGEDYYETEDSNDECNGRETKMHCSASILNEQTFVTAAHCFVENGEIMSKEKISEMTVYVGANEPTNAESLRKRRRYVQKVKINPKKVKIHQKYDKEDKSAYYDVAVVKIRGRFRFKQSIWPICLPGIASNEIDEWKGSGLTLAAYGENTKNDVEDDEVLTAETFFGQTYKLCNEAYDVGTLEAEHEQIQTSLPRLFNDNTIFCASVPSTAAGTCPGDSGGTLLKTEFIDSIGDIRSILVGVVHGSIKVCDGSRFPSIFSRMDNYDILSWVVEEAFGLDEVDKIKMKKENRLSAPIAPQGPKEGTLIEDTFEDRQCARRATSSVRSPCLEWVSKENVFDGPVEERDGGKCLYNCNPNDGMFCRVNYEKKLFNGKTKGLCFLNKQCFGTPDACEDCTAKCPG